MARQIFQKDPQVFIKTLAEALKKIPQFEKPEWANYVKSSSGNERIPSQEDFWYIRSASVLRQLYIKGVVGVNRLKTRYGKRKNRGGKPSRFRKGSGKIIRTILQKAEEAGFVEKVNRLQFGRRLTAKGREFLDSITIENPKPVKFNEDVKKETKEVNKENEDGKQEGQEE